MPRLCPLLTVAAALAVAVAACSPEVVIARSEQTAGMAGGGTGDMPANVGAAAGGEGGTDTPEPARLLADSVADFSLTQGEHGWYYGYDDGSLTNFAFMTRTSVITAYVPATNDVWDCWVNDTAHWTQLFQLGGHPNGTATSPPSVPLLQRAVRRWLSTFEGDVTISGELAKIDVVVGSNGVDGSVYVDGVLLYTAFVGGDDGGGLSYEVAASLKLASTVDFVLDPHDSDDHHDLSRFSGVIARALAPSSR
jgi:hypothetical protein